MSMENKNFFEKQPLSVDGQLARLNSRGLAVQDKLVAKHYLNYISYYRFCGYAIEFEDESINGEKRYQPLVSFEQILNCYVFDRKLRLLIIDAIERIEIAIRTTIINELSIKYNSAHWYLDKKLFLPKFKHNDLIRAVEKETKYKARHRTVQYRKREIFLQHYFRKYQNPKLPPIWMVAEVLSLGTWSSIFANLAMRENQKMVCNHFNLNYKVMTSWLHALTYLRNLCAHHGKIWSRNFTLRPLIAKSYREQLENNSKFSAYKGTPVFSLASADNTGFASLSIVFHI